MVIAQPYAVKESCPQATSGAVLSTDLLVAGGETHDCARIFVHVRPPLDHSDSARDALSDNYEGHVPSQKDGGDGKDVRARWAESAAQAASQAYAAAYGREIADNSTRMRWRLEPRVAVTAAFVVVLIGVGAWWSSSSAPSLPAHAVASPSPGASLGEGAGGSGDGTAPAGGSAQAEGAEPFVVHVSGAVARPGLVTVPEGARVADAVEHAGGVVSGADVAAVNLARLARDGEQIHIPLEGEVPASGAVSGPVSLNSADAAGLETLPGVGPVLAERIIADREANGPYASVEDLARVSGVGDAMVASLEDLAQP